MMPFPQKMQKQNTKRSFCYISLGKQRGVLNPLTDDSETNLGESETNHRNQTTNQYYFILHSVTDATSLVMQKWWFDVVCTCFELKTIKTWSQPQFPDVPSLISKV